jgi:hypothetical protein
MLDQLDDLREISQKTVKKEAAEREKRKRKAKLEIGPIDGVLPYEGRHNPLSRSNTSYKSGMLLRTKESNFVPRVALNDSEAEEATKIEAILQPNVYAVHCQPVKIRLPGGDGKPLHHTFDIGIQLDCGRRKLIYVRGQISLNSRNSHTRIADIVRHTPRSAADEVVVISDASFSRVYRDNNRRILICHQMPNPEADRGVVDLVQAARPGARVEDIVAASGLPEHVAFQAILRMIGAGLVGAERDFVIDYPSLIWSLKNEQV